MDPNSALRFRWSRWHFRRRINSWTLSARSSDVWKSSKSTGAWSRMTTPAALSSRSWKSAGTCCHYLLAMARVTSARRTESRYIQSERDDICEGYQQRSLLWKEVPYRLLDAVTLSAYTTAELGPRWSTFSKTWLCAAARIVTHWFVT